MSIEEIENDELREFAEAARENGFSVDNENGILSLKDHKVHYDFEVIPSYKEGSWEIRNLDTEENISVPFGELHYSNGMLI